MFNFPTSAIDKATIKRIVDAMTPKLKALRRNATDKDEIRAINTRLTDWKQIRAVGHEWAAMTDRERELILTELAKERK